MRIFIKYSMNLNKQQARKLFINKRSQLSQVEYATFNQLLLEQFKLLDLSTVSCIHLFLPIKERKEPDTFLIREWLKIAHPRIKRTFPQADFANNTMQNYLDDDELILTSNAFGIPEPIAGNAVNAEEIDLMIVPLLAFDRRGYRAGYGKGFYDRFMAQCKPGTRFIGLSFFEPVEAIDDIDQYDMKMNECITPKYVYKF
jgi:5-formyltetrahydrofolate cyclo-ligase